MPHHSAVVLKERLKAFVFYYEYKKNQQKTNSFHPTHFPHFTKNGMSLVKISLLIGIGYV